MKYTFAMFLYYIERPTIISIIYIFRIFYIFNYSSFSYETYNNYIYYSVWSVVLLSSLITNIFTKRAHRYIHYLINDFNFNTSTSIQVPQMKRVEWHRPPFK